MVKSCAVDICRNRGSAQGKKSYFSFPLSYPSLCREWLAAIRKREYVPTKNSYICEDHFVPSDILPRDQRKILKRHAVPFFPEKANRKGRPRKTKAVVKGCSRMTGGSEDWYVSVTDGDQSVDQSKVFLIQSDHAVQVQDERIVEAHHSYAKSESSLRSGSLATGPTLKRLQKQIRDLTLKAQRQAKTIERLKKVVEAQEEEKLRIRLEVASTQSQGPNRLSSLQLALLEHEIENQNRSKMSSKYGHEVRAFAHQLYTISPEAYRYLRGIITLPTERHVADGVQSSRTRSKSDIDPMSTSIPEPLASAPLLSCAHNNLDSLASTSEVVGARLELPGDHVEPPENLNSNLFP